MFRYSLFLVLGLMAALALGCEKKESTSAAPSSDAVDAAAADSQDAGEAAAGDAAAAVEAAAEEAEEAADGVKKAAEDFKIPGQ